MRQHKLEIYPVPMCREITCWIESPAYGDVGQPAYGYLRRVVLNDGENRVQVYVYNHDLELEHIKAIVRTAIGQKPKATDVRNVRGENVSG